MRIAKRARRKNIKIAPARGGQANNRIHSFDFFAPFNFLFFEQENIYKCQQNQRQKFILSKAEVAPKSLHSILRLSADLLYRFYNI
jgi:hypothetical protein